MKISLTNTSKAKNLLKSKYFDISSLEKGSAKNLVLNEEQVMKIIRAEKDNPFELLDQAAELLKTSLITRTTGHKKHDFSSIQQTSSLRLTNLYRDIKRTVNPVDTSGVSWEKLDPKVKKEITKKIESAYKEFKSINATLKLDDDLNERLKNFLDSNKAQQTQMLQESISQLHNRGILSKHITLTKTQNRDKWNEEVEHEVKVQTVSSGVLGAIGAGMGGMLLGVNSIGLGGMVVGATSVVTAAVGASFLGFGVALTAAAAITGVVLYYKKDSLGAIANKKSYMRTQARYERAIKKLNNLEDYIEDKVINKDKSKPNKITINEEIIKLISDFLKVQNEDWDHYTDAAKREYDKPKGDEQSTKHISGLVKVKDEKTSSIGLLKQGIANQWCKITLGM